MHKKLLTYSYERHKQIQKEKKELIAKLQRKKDLDVLAQEIKDRHERKMHRLSQRGAMIDWSVPMEEYKDILTGAGKLYI